ncbi:MAG: hypothetical protein IJE22_02650 [Oscillibacter sp.]|nr:hypothetical protein [Oscillibacter sp.]
MITDWLMVAITAVYVVATIFICRANIKSADATREQVAEAKRQYEEEHRAYISYEFIYERRAFYGMRFTNHGRRVATNVQVLLKQEFIDSLPPNSSFRSSLLTLKEREFTLGIGQSYDIYFGGNEFSSNSNKQPIEGTIVYSDAQKTYSETFYIDFEKYAAIFTVDSDADALVDVLKKQHKELTAIKRELQQIRLKLASVQTAEEGAKEE